MGLGSHMENEQINNTNIIKEYEHLCNIKNQMVVKQQQLQNDLIGIGKTGQDRMQQLEKMKGEYHRKIDILHMLRMDGKANSS